MKVFRTKSEMLLFLDCLREHNSIGFIPTMGALHKGHLKLVERSKTTCQITICSIFVNPTQFNNSDDFKRYPNTLDLDLDKLQSCACDIVYMPSVEDVYAEGEEAKKFDFGSLDRFMEGRFRPGHFNGVATIIEKLFRIIMPDKAFFGEKDLQQLQIIKELVKQTDFQTEIVGVSTVREKNGLAKSSRNNLLSQKDKESAVIIYKSLKYCVDNKQKGIAALKSHIYDKFKRDKSVDLEYIQFVSLKTMEPILHWEGQNQNAICIAAYINKVRLIDNIIL